MNLNYECLDLEQGSELWLKERLKYVTASQVPTLMGVSPYLSMLELIEEKITGQAPEVDGYKKVLFAKGHDAERAAREWIETQTNSKFPPQVILSKRCALMASLDGFNSETNTILEAKLIGAAALEDVKKGKIKPHHEYQVQAQLLASGAEKCIYFATIASGDSAVIEIKPKADYAKSITSAVEKFMQDLEEVVVCERAYKDAIERVKKKHTKPSSRDPFSKIKRRYK